MICYIIKRRCSHARDYRRIKCNNSQSTAKIRN
uniref:Uncharacterized protein n=1 Tax=Rhizophora mucronata TaxID=61149 RepID=A0A2P2QJG2_RHIMU